jgi:hypothetical protein
VKDENGDLLADSYNISNKWKNHFSQLLDVLLQGVSDVKHKEIQSDSKVLSGFPF